MRKLYSFQIVIEREQQGESYSAYSPTLAGCFRRARTFEEAKRGIRQALGERLRSTSRRGVVNASLELRMGNQAVQ